MPLRIALTGAQGFIGSHLKLQLRDVGHRVVPLARGQPEGEFEWIPFRLEAGIEIKRLQGFDVLIHAAHDFSLRDGPADRERNVNGSIRLFGAAQAAGVKELIFVSTLSAFPGCRSKYGRGKLEVESRVSELQGKSARLGFVYDETERGLSGSLRKLASRLPVVPVPGSGKQALYLMPAADLGPALLAVVDRAAAGSVVSIASAEPVSLSGLLRQYAKEAGKSVRLIPFPWQVMWLGLYSVEQAGGWPGFRSDSLLSLMNQNPHPDFEPLRRLGIRCGGRKESPIFSGR